MIRALLAAALALACLALFLLLAEARPQHVNAAVKADREAMRWPVGCEFKLAALVTPQGSLVWPHIRCERTRHRGVEDPLVSVIRLGVLLIDGEV